MSGAMRTAEVRVRNGVKEKRCTKCEKWKPFTKFHKDNASPLGIRSHCAKCTNERKMLKTKDPDRFFFEGRRYNGEKVQFLKVPHQPELRGRRIYKKEFQQMLRDGYLAPGTIIKDKEVDYVVCSSGRAWLEFKQAGFPLDYKLPAGELRAI